MRQKQPQGPSAVWGPLLGWLVLCSAGGHGGFLVLGARIVTHRSSRSCCDLELLLCGVHLCGLQCFLGQCLSSPSRVLRDHMIPSNSTGILVGAPQRF